MNNKKSGNAGEDITAQVLGARGVDMLVKIHTPYKIIGEPIFRKGKKYYPIVFSEKAEGDRRGVLNGLSVLAEVKTVSGNLRYSELKPHQHELLTYHHAVGGISLLVWVSEQGVFVMDWAELKDVFLPRTSISIEDAKAFDVMDLKRHFDGCS